MKIFALISLLLIFSGCPEGNFGTFDPNQEKLTHEELVAALEKVNVDELRAKAEAGDYTALNDLGLLYVFGIHVGQDEDQAVRCFQEAAEKEEPFAMNNLAVAYLKGVGPLSRDQIEAHKWLNLARASADRQNRGEGADLFTETMKNIEYYWFWTSRRKLSAAHQRAREWTEAKYGPLEHVPGDDLFAAADRGEPNAEIAMAKRFHYGEKVPANNVLSYKWYTLFGQRDSRWSSFVMLKSRMTKEDMAEGERLAQEWRTAHGS